MQKATMCSETITSKAVMASSQLSLSMLVLISVFLVFTNPTHSFPVNYNAPSASPRSSKVSLNLYYETLCPYCKTFIVEKLVKVFTTDLNTIVNLRLVPYGNAQVVPPGQSIICQHGEDECYLNAIHACAISIWPEPKKHFSFIRCVENGGKSTQQHSKEADPVWQKCAKKFGGLKSIKNCYDSGYAKKLILQYANETDHLIPPQEYVPWVTVNKQPLYGKYEDFVAEVCKAYKGEAVPEACKSVQSSRTATAKATHQACYLGEARDSISR